MKQEIDVTRKYRTRDGREVTGLHDTGMGTYPISGWVGGNRKWWTDTGGWMLHVGEKPLDLIPVAEEPAVTLPEPPAGMKWEYRGKEWYSERATFCYRNREGGVTKHTSSALAAPGEYWEAVPTGLTDVGEPARENIILDEHRRRGELLDDYIRDKEILANELGTPMNHDVMLAEIRATKRERQEWKQVGELRTQEAEDWRSQFDAMKADLARVIRKHGIEPVSPTSGMVEDIDAGIEGLKDAFQYLADGKAELHDYIGTLVLQRDNWEQTAADFEKARRYHRDLLVQCGEAIGKEAYTADDGTTQGDVLVAKVPELVRELAEKRAEPFDHTEGGKYRMLEEGESVERGDEYFWHNGKRWEPVQGHIGRPFDEPFWGSPMRRPVNPDYAQQAKDLLQARFVTGFPTFRENTLDTFVDLILKAAKQP